MEPKDSTFTIVQSVKRFFSGVMLSRISGLLRDLAMAYAFGTQGAVAAFLVAFRFAHLLRRLFGEGALQTAFVPCFEQLRVESPQRACRFFSHLFLSLSGLLTLLILLTMGAIWWVLKAVELSPIQGEILWLTLLLMPSLLFICLFGLNASLLQCEKRYFTTGVAPVAFNLIWVCGVLLLKELPITHAMEWLSAWVILACFAQWIVTYPGVQKVLKTYKQNLSSDPYYSLPWKDRIKSHLKDLSALGAPLALGILGVAAAQINNAVDSLFAIYAEAEGPAFLWYAIRIQQLPLALFGVALSGALLPPLTRAIKNQQYQAYEQYLQFALSRSLMVMVPITLAIYTMGETAVWLIYGRGDFDAISVAGTTRCLIGYGAGLVPMTMVLVLSPAYFAFGNFRSPALFSAISVIVNISLNSLFVLVWGLGSESVAYATSISAIINVLLLAKKLPYPCPLLSSQDRYNTLKVILVALAATILTLQINSVHTSGFLNCIVLFSQQSICFIGIYAILGWLFRLPNPLGDSVP